MNHALIGEFSGKVAGLPPLETRMKHVDIATRMKQTLQGQRVLAPLTRVKRNVGGWLGTVQKYDCSVGGFPVRYDGGMWELVGIDDVTVVQPERVRKRPRPATMSR